MNLDGLKRLLGQAGQAVAKAAPVLVPGAGLARLIGQSVQKGPAPQARPTDQGGFGPMPKPVPEMPPYAKLRPQMSMPTQFDENRFRSAQFDVPFGFPIPGGSNSPRLYEDQTYGRDTRGGLEIPQGMPGVTLYEDGSYADRRPRY